MNIRVSQTDLAKALALVNRAVSPNNTLPVLNNILIKAEGKRLQLSATNLEIAIQASCEAQVENEGALTVPAKVFTSYVSLINDADLQCGVQSGNTLFVQSKGSQTKIKGIASDEFPLLPKFDTLHRLVLPVKATVEALDQVIFAASTNISRPVLTGVYFQMQSKVLKIAATDSYRLGEKTLEVSDLDAEGSFIVPSRTTQELMKILSSASEEKFEVLVGKGQIQFKVDSVELTSRLIEGAYPDYEKILPKESKTQFIVNTDELALALKKVSVIVRENSNNVRLKVKPEGIQVFSDETQVGQGASELSAQVSGEPLETALNVQYLLDVLAHIGASEVKLGLNDGLSPVMVTAASGGNYLHIIMPLKV